MQRKTLNKIMREFIDNKGIKLRSLAKNTNIKYNLMICYFTKNQKIDILDYFEICNVLDIEPNHFINLLKKGENSNDDQSRKTKNSLEA